MGRVSKLDQSRITANHARAAYYVGEVAQAATRILLSEGLYLALLLNTMLVTGRVKRDGVFGAQRTVLIDLVKDLRTLTSANVPLVNLRPLGWADGILEAFENALDATEDDDEGTTYYVKVDEFLRILMVLSLPSMLRTVIEIIKQTIEVG